ncbi:MAG: hypothetical protein KDA96_27095 [Planctomycetaceae bacterium]|nr:hypothetical protein [Planctomycetaceae bacterium]
MSKVKEHAAKNAPSHSPVGECAHRNVAVQVRQRLMSATGVEVASLVVRQVPGGICLEGVVTCQDSELDLRSVLRGIVDAEVVNNRLVVRRDQ